MARSNTSVTIVAANANRKGVTITNDTSAFLYIRFGSGASTSSDYSIRMTGNSYIEIPFYYTGQITGIWASIGAGSALVTEVV